jgi:formylglycine-generating enzyme required for sulfatase activity
MGWAEQKAHPNRPVVGVSWFEAMAYCRWAKCRLLTEAEWEMAARRTRGRYPWGNSSPSSDVANFKLQVGFATPVGMYPGGETSDAIADMAGNVWEWVSDWFDEAHYGSTALSVLNPKGPNSGSFRVIRGGSWVASSQQLRVSYRDAVQPEFRGTAVGFRCAQDTSA